jgi:hypothetical protein
MIFQSPNNPNSHLTVKERENVSFPTRVLWERNQLTGEILDFGCGLGKDISFLQEKGFNVEGYDPYYAPQYPEKQYDIICNYVLNVLLPEEQAHVFMAVSELLKKAAKPILPSVETFKKVALFTIPKETQKSIKQMSFCPILLSSSPTIAKYMNISNLRTKKKALLSQKLPQLLRFW